MSDEKRRRPAWRRYLYEFLTVFAGVTLAFLLDQWNDGRRETRAEEKTLIEIRNGLVADLSDMDLNVMGHRGGLMACGYFRRLANGVTVPGDSVAVMHYLLLRDYVSIQNSAGYEALRSRGLELIRDDSLRVAIINLYDFQYEALQKLEEDYGEMQFYRGHGRQVDELLTPVLLFDTLGRPVDIRQPLALRPAERNALLLTLWRIEGNRRFMMSYYQQTEEEVRALIGRIDQVIGDTVAP
ncbi:MAG: hypothetical protein WBA12_02350 [Catalinimonas sp.]